MGAVAAVAPRASAVEEAQVRRGQHQTGLLTVLAGIKTEIVALLLLLLLEIVAVLALREREWQRRYATQSTLHGSS